MIKLPLMLRETHKKIVEKREEWYTEAIEEIASLKKSVEELENRNSKLNIKILAAQQNYIKLKEANKNIESLEKQISEYQKIHEENKIKQKSMKFCINEFKRVKSELEKENIKLMQELSKTPKYKYLR